MIEFRFKDIFSDSYATFEFSTLSNIKQVFDLLKLIFHTRGGCVGAQLGDEDLLALKELLGIRSSVSEEGIEMIASPLDAMFDLIREISKGAHWDGLFRWILRISVALSLVRNDHLLVSLGSKSARFK